VRLRRGFGRRASDGWHDHGSGLEHVWGGESFSEWMWNVAFDGIGSTAIATLVAVYFVLRTLRNDRQLAGEAVVQQQRLDREAAFEAWCQRALDAARRITKGGTFYNVHTSDLGPWLTDVRHLALSAPPDEALLVRILQAAVDSAEQRVRGITGTVGHPEVVNAVLSVESALQKRLALPDYFRAVDVEVGDDAVLQIETGAKYLFP
jgi:hypothetical protein